MRSVRQTANVEQTLQRAICQWIELHGGIAHLYKIPPAFKGRTYRSPYLRNGTADILALWYGKFIAIEVKRPASPGKPKGVVSSDQLSYLGLIHRKGGTALTAYSVKDVSDVLLPLRHLAGPRLPFQAKDEEE